MRFAFKRTDLLFVEAYYTQPGDQPIKVKCTRCGGNLIFSKDKDDPQDRFYCYNATSTNNCFDRRRHEIENMWPGALVARLETHYDTAGEKEDPVIIEEGTDGVKKFGRTRKMTYDERYNYYQKAVDYLRAKMARGE